MEMKWCEHSTNAENDGYWFPFDGGSGAQVKCSKTWQFCPICGTPRPEEKDLLQKFREFIVKSAPLMTNNSIEELVKIAEQHFEERKSS